MGYDWLWVKGYGLNSSTYSQTAFIIYTLLPVFLSYHAFPKALFLFSFCYLFLHRFDD